MLSSRQIRRAQQSLVLAGMSLAAFYFFVFRPLTDRAGSLNAPLVGAWKKLSAAGIHSNQEHELNLVEIAKNLEEVKSAVATLERAHEQIQSAIALDPAVREKMAEPFQLVDFQIEELLRIEELGRAAGQQQVRIAPAVFSNFPEYRADREEPELLWGQLAFLHQLLATAVQCKVASIENIELPPYVAHGRATNTPAFLYEIPIQAEFVGSMESVSKLLAALPLRAEVIDSASLAELAHGKPAMFIQRIVLKKNSPANPDEAHLQLRACGFIYRDW